MRRRNMILCVNLLFCFKLSLANDIRTIRKRSSGGVDLASLAALPQGSELYTLENLVDKRKSYQLEDFFWTGSGDGGFEEQFATNLPDFDNYNTIYTTKTIFSTIYIDSSTSPTSPTGITNQSEVINATCSTCDSSGEGGISPTPTITYPLPDEDADAQYWIVTVLKGDAGEKQPEPVLEDIRNSLAKLYQIAFQRQQKYHLTGETLRSKRHDKPSTPTVRVTIHKFGNTSENNGRNKMEIVYHVSLYGQPVDPITASADMSLVSDAEMQQELGYPFWIKAEPYIKLNASEQKAQTNASWLVISSVIACVLVVLVAVALLSFCLSTRKQRGKLIQQQIASNRSPTYVNYGCTESEVEHQGVQTSASRQNSPPLMVASFPDSQEQVQRKIKPSRQYNHHYRPRAAMNRTVPLSCVMTEVKPSHLSHKHLSSSTTSSSSCSSSASSTICSNIPTPTSYLSMPSVKEFPYNTSGHPEPLSRVLEPVVVQHLDHPDHVDISPTVSPIPLPRSHSLATASDPGVINPMVWQWKEEQQGGRGSRMRQRLNSLLDDTFSLFGAADGQSGRSKSAVFVSRQDGSTSTTVQSSQRPTSCVAAPPSTTSKGIRRGAWEDSGSPRPGSAPILVDQVQVQAQGRMSPSDPALPLIKAIKTEIGKCNRNN